MLPVPACTVCGETERTIVAEYNRLIFLDAVWRSDLARYDYALCHGCGLVHPTRRPDREEYEYLTPTSTSSCCAKAIRTG